MATRRGFFRSLFQGALTAAALAYCPRALQMPEVTRPSTVTVTYTRTVEVRLDFSAELGGQMSLWTRTETVA